MRCTEVLPPKDEMQTEADAADAQLQSIKKQEQALKLRKAQAQANKAQQKLSAARKATFQTR
jgi:hypothetical protein